METKSKAVAFRKYFVSNLFVVRFSVSRILSRGKRSSFVLNISQKLLSALSYRGAKFFTRRKKKKKERRKA